MATLAIDLDGATDIPNGKIAVIITYLEMLQAPQDGPAHREDVRLERWQEPEPEAYRELFRAVGRDWIWFGRLTKSDADLRALLADPLRENYLPMIDGKPVGTLELNFADPANVEVSYFGLLPGATGGGLGRWLMGQALEMAWARPETRRVWLHTCTADSPHAIRFYRSCGFTAYKRAVEIADDPRLAGLHPQDVAPHIPVIGS